MKINMKIRINFSKRVIGRNHTTGEKLLTGANFDEAKDFYHQNKNFVDDALFNYLFVNAGPELISANGVRLPIITKHPRIVALYFKFIGYNNNEAELALMEVVYPKSYQATKDSIAPNSVSSKAHESSLVSNNCQNNNTDERL